jgi:hypothetical protein
LFAAMLDDGTPGPAGMLQEWSDGVVIAVDGFKCAMKMVLFVVSLFLGAGSLYRLRLAIGRGYQGRTRRGTE